MAGGRGGDGGGDGDARRRRERWRREVDEAAGEEMAERERVELLAALEAKVAALKREGPGTPPRRDDDRVGGGGGGGDGSDSDGDSLLARLDRLGTPGFAASSFAAESPLLAPRGRGAADAAARSPPAPSPGLASDFRELRRQLDLGGGDAGNGGGSGDDDDDDDDEKVSPAAAAAPPSELPVLPVGVPRVHQRRVSFAATNDAVLLLGNHRMSAPASARSAHSRKSSGTAGLVSAGASTGASAAGSVFSSDDEGDDDNDGDGGGLNAAEAASFYRRTLSLGAGAGAGSGGAGAGSPSSAAAASRRRGKRRAASAAAGPGPSPAVSDLSRALASQGEELRRLASENAELRERLASETRRARRARASATRAEAARAQAEERHRAETIERETQFVKERRAWEEELRELGDRHERYVAALAQRAREEEERTREHYERRLVAVERRSEEARSRHQAATRERDTQIEELSRRISSLVSRIEAMGGEAASASASAAGGAPSSAAGLDASAASAAARPPGGLDLAALLRDEMVRSGSLEERLRSLTDRHSRLKTRIASEKKRRRERRRTEAALSGGARASLNFSPPPVQQGARSPAPAPAPRRQPELAELLHTPPSGAGGGKRHSAPPATAERQRPPAAALDEELDAAAAGGQDDGGSNGAAPAPAATKEERERAAVRAEAVSSEEAYLGALQRLVEGLGQHTLADEVRSLVQLHAGLLTVMRSDGPAAALVQFGPFLRLYTQYVARFDEALELGTRRGHGLASLLIAPVQRLPRYELLMDRLQKCTEEPAERRVVGRAFELVRRAAADVDNGRRRFEAAAALFDAARDLGAPDLVQPHRVLVARAEGVSVDGDEGCTAVLCSDLLVWARDGAEAGRLDAVSAVARENGVEVSDADGFSVVVSVPAADAAAWTLAPPAAGDADAAAADTAAP